MATVLLFSDDPRLRERIRVAVGRTPDAELGPIRWLEAEDSPTVTAHAREADLIVLDGESQPAGGLGISRQLKNELADCPPTLVLVARKDDAWLGRWSRADAVLPMPVDPPSIAETVVRLLRDRLARPPVPVERGLFGLPKRRH